MGHFSQPGAFFGFDGGQSLREGDSNFCSTRAEPMQEFQTGKVFL